MTTPQIPQIPSADEFLMGGGIPAASFPTIGTTVEGEIVEPPRVEQQRDLTTGEAKYWADGSPMLQLRVVIQTGQIDTSIPDDDGRRTLYVRGNMLKAVRQAVRAARAKGLEVGGRLTVTYSGDGEPTKRGFNPPKLYTAAYVPPSQTTANDFLMNGGQTAAPAPAAAPAAPVVPQAAPASAPASAAPAVPQIPGLTPEQAAALAKLTPEQRAALGFG